MPKYPDQSGMTFEQRLAFGRSRRTVVRRVNQGPWVPPLKRRDPIDILVGANSLLSADLAKLKMARMKESPFQFFRGATAVMAYDLSTTLTVGLRVQMCGDAHILNLSNYDIFDLGQTCPGPFEWDLKRLATSFAIAAEDARESKSNRELAVATVVRSYREALTLFAVMTDAELANFKVSGRLVNDGPMIDQPLLWRKATANEDKEILASLPAYRESLAKAAQTTFDKYRASAVGFEVIGIGTLTSRNYITVFFGENIDDTLTLRFCEARPSDYAPYVADAPKDKHQGQRITQAQRTLQKESDAYLGYTTIDSKDYVVNQFQKPKAIVNPLELKGPLLTELAHICAQVLAKAHALSGDAVVISGYIGQGDKFAEAITRFATSYATQNKKDFEVFLSAT